MSYRFEEVQKLRFVVYDIDNDTPSLSDDDLLGYHECTLAQVCVGKVLRGHVEQLHMRNLQVTLSSITNVYTTCYKGSSVVWLAIPYLVCLLPVHSWH